VAVGALKGARVAMGQRREGGSWNPMVEERFFAIWACEPRLVVRSVTRQQNEEDCEAYDDDWYGYGEEVEFQHGCSGFQKASGVV